MVASGSSDHKRRKSLAWCAFWKLEQLWKSPHISITTKVKLFNTTKFLCHYTTLWLWIVGDLPGYGKQNQSLCYLMLQSHTEYKSALTMFWTPPSIPWLTLCLWFIWLGTASWNFLVTSSECQRKSLLEDMLCTFQPLAKGDLVDHILHSLIMYKDCLGIMKEQCKNSRLPHLLMIVVHVWSPAPQPMDDDDV